MVELPNDDRFDPGLPANFHASHFCRTADHQSDIDRQLMMVAMKDQVLERPSAAGQKDGDLKRLGHRACHGVAVRGAGDLIRIVTGDWSKRPADQVRSGRASLRSVE